MEIFFYLNKSLKRFIYLDFFVLIVSFNVIIILHFQLELPMTLISNG